MGIITIMIKWRKWVSLGDALLELFYCSRNIFLEGTFMVVTAGRKWRDFLELTPPAERINLFTEATTNRRREFSSPVNFRRMCWFLNIVVPYRLRENSEQGANSFESLAFLEKYAVTYICEIVLSRLWPRGVPELLCCVVFFSAYSAVNYIWEFVLSWP